MLKKIFLIVIMCIFISGCYDGSSNEDQPIAGFGSNHDIDQDVVSYNVHHDTDNVYEFLAGVGKSKFFEGRIDSAISQLNTYSSAFRPAFVPGHMHLWRVAATGASYAIQYNSVADGSPADFVWAPVTSTEVHMNEIFGRGEIAGYWKEYNGITYAVTEWADRNTQVSTGYMLVWVQHGYGFKSSVPASFTLEEALAFSYAVPIESWELDGDAVSVSIQDMTDVTIVALGNPSARGGIRQEVIVSGDTLYLHGLARDGSLERIGYRWPVGRDTGRYQYVLAPGTYEFRASGTTTNSELLVRHFEAGEIVAVTDFTAEVSASGVTQFALIVTPDEVYDFTTEPGEPPELLSFSVTPDDFISIFETDRNTREWQVTFWVTETFDDGSQNRFMTDFIIPGPNANLRGSYVFADDHILAGHIIVFDIRNNGSNIVTFALFNNNDPAGVELRMAYLTIESTDYLEYDVD